ncbi:hypothetical protein HID58_055623 [Brassica napus]|uniref:Uncharacterized protein n=1 Tax=Brassica napus TaxID=3708 RepID=A0ABQ8AKW7_BRANA|nr:hypothetical protein HID58_055623 [Brassica napus]
MKKSKKKGKLLSQPTSQNLIIEVYTRKLAVFKPSQSSTTRFIVKPTYPACPCSDWCREYQTLECVFAVRWSWLSFMSKHMKEKKRVASDNEGE